MALTIRLAQELEDRYTELAKSTGRTRSFYINKALSEAIDQLEYEFRMLNDAELKRSKEKEENKNGKNSSNR